MMQDLLNGLSSPIIPTEDDDEYSSEKKTTEERLLCIIETLLEMKKSEGALDQQQAAPVPQFNSFMLDSLQ